MASVRSSAGGESSPHRRQRRRLDSARPTSRKATPPSRGGARDGHPRTSGGSKTPKTTSAGAAPAKTPTPAKTTSVRRPRTPDGRRFTRRAAMLGVVVAVLTLSLAYPTKQYLQQRGQIAQNQQDQVAQRQRIADLADEKSRWSDDAYVREQARERLQYVERGELTYVVTEDGRVDQPGSGTETDDGASGTPGAPGAWYDQVWDQMRNSKLDTS